MKQQIDSAQTWQLDWAPLSPVQIPPKLQLLFDRLTWTEKVLRRDHLDKLAKEMHELRRTLYSDSLGLIMGENR